MVTMQGRRLTSREVAQCVYTYTEVTMMIPRSVRLVPPVDSAPEARIMSTDSAFAHRKINACVSIKSFGVRYLHISSIAYGETGLLLEWQVH